MTISPQRLLVALAMLVGSTSSAFTHISTSITRASSSPSTILLRSATERSHISVNPLVANVKVSKTVEVFGKVKELEAQGVSVTSLCVGEPDFPPPQVVLDAAAHAVLQGDTKYTAVTGTAALRQAIAVDLLRRKGLNYNPTTEIVVGNGAKQSVYQSVLAVCGADDQVLIPTPYWPSYPEMARLAGSEPVLVQATAEHGYLLTPEQLREALTNHPKIKLMILCNPSNPTGGVYSRTQLQALATVLQDFPQVAILADEIYERLVYPEPKDAMDDFCPAFASISPDMFDRTLTINGFSKAYAMTGLRLGYVAAPARFAKAVTTIQSQLTSCAGSISQAAGVAALTQVPDQVLHDNAQLMKSKRDFVLQELSTMPHVQLAQPPRGAFYVLPDLSTAYHGDDTQLCLDLLEQQQLALVPGSSFGAPGAVRISYATSMEELTTAMNKLRAFLEALPPPTTTTS